MPQVLLPDLDDEDEEPGRTVLPPSRAARGKSLLKIGMEVALITTGVFLGLMGEEWRERAEQRELARTSDCDPANDDIRSIDDAGFRRVLVAVAVLTQIERAIGESK
jgi:hypothetical protein